jgi:hypothetical protein
MLRSDTDRQTLAQQSRDECSLRQFAALDEFADLTQPSQLCLPEE